MLQISLMASFMYVSDPDLMFDIMEILTAKFYLNLNKIIVVDSLFCFCRNFQSYFIIQLVNTNKMYLSTRKLFNIEAVT
jgi:hypothetical protein